MGDLIEGIGDEVLLFVSFLAVSVVFLFFVTARRSQRTPAPPPEGQPNLAPAARPPQGVGPDLPTQDQANENTGIPDGLRHRFHPNVVPGDSQGASDGAQGQPNDESGRVDNEPTEGIPASTSNEFTIKLIRAGGPERSEEVRVTRNTTLEQLRR